MADFGSARKPVMLPHLHRLAISHSHFPFRGILVLRCKLFQRYPAVFRSGDLSHSLVVGLPSVCRIAMRNGCISVHGSDTIVRIRQSVRRVNSQSHRRKRLVSADRHSLLRRRSTERNETFPPRVRACSCSLPMSGFHCLWNRISYPPSE